MHELQNTGKSILTIPTGNGRATILPNQTKSFEPGLLGAGLLKALQGEKSVLKLKNLSDKAKELAAKAAARVKRKGFAIVHGAGDISVEEALRREKTARIPRPVQVRDEFTKTAAKSQHGLGPASDESDEVEQPHGDELEEGEAADLGGDGGDAQGAGSADGKTERVKLEEVHPAVTLLAQVEEETISMKDLRKAAKEILGDLYPAGQVGKDGIVDALKTVLKKKA